MKTQRPATGFTLIELLIVVAIIAILAAIAVPNFLEAQVRSKVSRAHADMRSLANAVEAYRVDHNRFPLDGDDFAQPQSFDVLTRLVVLTTPIAFIASIPEDPFHTENIDMGYAAVLFMTGPPYPLLYNTLGTYTGQSPTGPTIANRGNPANYTLTSIGPNQQFDSIVGRRLLYDASNGTRSAGDIHRSGGNNVEP